MDRLATIVFVLALSCSSHAEMRTWTGTDGKTIEGEYVSVLFDSVVIKDPQGRQVKIRLDMLSRPDKDYVQLASPPKLKVDFMESLPQRQIDGKSWESNSGTLFVPDPVFMFNAQYGARITQLSNVDYTHKLTAEIIVLTKQVYDPSKYHYIVRSVGAPFTLSDANKHKYEYKDEKVYTIMYYNHGGTEPRGERPAEMLVLVRDERGEVIAYNSTKKWLFNNYEKLLDLPVGAWVNNHCARVYPTSPKRWSN